MNDNKFTENSMFGRVYGDARMPNWLHRHRTSLSRIASPGLRQNKGGKFTEICEK